MQTCRYFSSLQFCLNLWIRYPFLSLKIVGRFIPNLFQFDYLIFSFGQKHDKECRPEAEKIVDLHFARPLTSSKTLSLHPSLFILQPHRRSQSLTLKKPKEIIVTKRKYNLRILLFLEWYMFC